MLKTLEHWDEDSNSYSVINHRNNVKDIIKKYINHRSIKNVKKKYKIINKFSFRPVTTDEVKKVIKAGAETGGGPKGLVPP